MISTGIEKILVPNRKENNGRRVFTDTQLKELEKLFAKNQYPNSAAVYEVSHAMHVTERQVRKWFTRRRYRRNFESTRVGSLTAKRAKKSILASNATQETKAKNASIAAQETKANAESTANKENTSLNRISGGEQKYFRGTQLRELEKLFAKDKYLKPSVVPEVSHDIGLTEKQILGWFDRQRRKRKAESMRTDRGTDAPNAKRAKKSNASLIEAQETKTNKLAVANKENRSPNVNEMRKEESENQNEEIGPSWNLEKAQSVMHQMIDQYKDLNPSQLMQAYFERLRYVSEMKKERCENKIQEIGPSWNLEKARGVMHQMIDQYKGLNPSQLMQAHFERSNVAKTQEGQSLVFRSEKNEIKNVFNNDNSKAESASSTVAFQENERKALLNLDMTREEERMTLRMREVMKQMVHQYKELCPTHLLAAHFTKENRNENTEPEILQIQQIFPEKKAAKRIDFKKEELRQLEALFEKKHYPAKSERKDLANELGIEEMRIQIWFKNRRALWRKQSKS